MMPIDQADQYERQMIQQEEDDKLWDARRAKLLQSEELSAVIVFRDQHGNEFEEYEYGTLQELKDDLPKLAWQIDGLAEEYMLNS